ncbi:MAG: sigma 54-interacting transcriptional regulator [Thermodesulfobacteriota bacterium]
MSCREKTAEGMAGELERARERISMLAGELEKREEEFGAYRRFFSGIKDLAYICDAEGRILFVNDAFERFTGRKVSEFTGKPFAPLFDDENLRKVIDNYTRALRGESPVFEAGFKETGTLCRYQSVPVTDAHGNITGVMGVARDITLQRKTEDELKRKSALLAETQRMARIGFWEWDLKRNRITWSDELYEVFGLDPRSFDPNSYEDFVKRVHPEDWKAVEAMVDKALVDKKPWSVRYRNILPDGGVRHIYARGEVVCDEDGAPVKLVGTCQDFTGQKVAEQRREESERKFKAIFDSAFDGMLIADPATRRFLIGNKTICRELGYTVDEIRSLGVDDIHPAQYVPVAVENLGKVYRGELSVARDVPVKRKDGSVFYTDITANKVTLGGKPYMLGVFRDTTILRNASDEAKKYKRGLEAIFRSVKDAILTVDTEMRIICLNEAAEKICGLSREFIGRRFDTLECDRRCLDAIVKCIREKKSVEMHRVVCERCNNEMGGRVITVSTRPLVGEQGEFTGAVLVIRDETRIADLERDLGQRKSFHNFIGQSVVIQSVFSLIETLAQTQTTVLITGESGTGKELVAGALHHTGVRRDRPFVKVNCAALPEQLLESELFGHVKGAFTGAVKDRVGRFELADGGTIFLDEIGAISHAVQVRLLRVLQEREFERVGDSRTRRVDIRIIAATNRDLAERVRRGSFREDLYYRLKVVELALPPLRDRLEDIPLLTEYFVERFNRKFGKEIEGLSDDVRSVLMSYDWPGNVRELEHALEHAFILCNGRTIEAGHLPPGFCSPTSSSTGSAPAEDEREEIIDALGRAAWNKAKAARLLGISRRTIYRKMERLDIREASR